MEKEGKNVGNWKKLQDEKGIYYHANADGSRIYMLRTSFRGKRINEGMGQKTLTEVREIQAILKANIERGTPPYTYKDLVAVQQEQATAALAAQRQEQKRIIAEDKKLRNSTVTQVWENLYWPERLKNTKFSQKDTQSIAARWIRLIKPFFGDIPMSELRKEHFVEFVRQCREIPVPARHEGEKPKKGKAAPQKIYSESTIHKCLANVRHLWGVAEEHSLVSGVFPGKSLVNSVKENERKVCYLELDEVKALLDTVFERRMKDRTHHDVFCYVTIALFLGLRAGDIHKLTQQSIERSIIEETKNGQARFVDFSLEPVQLMLKERLSLFPPENEKELIFVTSEGKPYTGVPRRYSKIISELGFNDIPRRRDNPREKIDFHALRHTYATHQMVSAGVSRENLQKLLGHKRPEMTMRYVEIADHIQARESRKILDAYGIQSALPK